MDYILTNQNASDLFSGYMLNVPGEPLAQYKRRWFYFPEHDKLFLSVTFLSEPEKLSMAIDGIAIYRPKDSKHPYFDSDWLCREYPQRDTTPALIKLKAKIKKECLEWVDDDQKLNIK